MNQLAQFERCEIKLGHVLGSGGFSNVCEIDSFHLTTPGALTIDDNNVVEARIQLANTAAANNARGARYAVKLPKKGLEMKREERSKTIEQVTKHLCNEAHVLGKLDHPNILKLRGLVSPDENDCCGIIVDRLEETLANRVSRWYQQEKRFSSAFQRKFGDREGDKRREVLVERLSVALGIARALAYLHKRNMIYRDLKPANIGFDADNNRPILFDMGLCRELPAGFLGERFEMSGKTGTIRYMSPEVRMLDPYNQKADVYSFSHVLWEILTLKKPYDGFSRGMHATRVAQRGERPPLDPSWPRGVRDLLERCWDPEPSARLNMEKVVQILEDELADLSSKKQSAVVLTLEPPISNKSIGRVMWRNSDIPIESDSSKTQVSLEDDTLHSC